KLRGVLRRRKIPVVATMVGVIGVAAALISQLEPGYKASAVIRADEVQPAKEYVPPTVAEQMGERLKSLRLSVMARPLVMQAARDLKMKHYGALPEQVEGNLRTLDQTTMELNIMETNLDLDQERRRALLASAMSPLRHHEETLAGELYEAKTRYTDEHPEVTKIRAEYEKIRAERLSDETNLLSKLRKNNPELAAIEGEIARTKAMVAGLRERQ